MPYCIVATLREDRWPAIKTAEDRVLTVEFDSRVAAEAELRYIQRLRRQRFGLHTLSWRTTDGRQWALSVYDLDDEVAVQELESAAG